MKRFLLTLCALCASTAIWAATASDLDYTISNGEVTITDCNSSASGGLIIPETLGGNPVTSIGALAFYNCTSLTSVTIPSSVTSIGRSAFSGCWGLTSVTIPSSVTSIGERVFYNCSGLTSIVIPEGVTSIGGYAFADCSGLTSVTIPSSVTSIGENAFREVAPTTLKAVKLPGNGMSQYDLTTIIIPEGTTSIPDSAFRWCTSLPSITIPSSVTSIGNYAFQYCRSLTSITIPSSVTSIGNYAFENCSGLTSVRISEGVTSIGAWAFYNCSGLTSVTIPSSVTSIGARAFSDCTSLTSVTIPSSVTSIGGGAFYNCSGLPKDANGVQYESTSKEVLIDVPESVTGTFIIPESVRIILPSALSGCSALTSVIIPSSVTSISSYAFSGCSGLTSITIPSSVTSIEERAFQYCSGLTSIVIPRNVVSIGEYAFYGCSNLSSVKLPSGLTTLGSYAFMDCPSLPTDANGVQYESANKVVLIDVPTSLTGEFVIPDTVRFIYGSAFTECTGLTSVTIPSSVTSIGNYAFSRCSGLSSITIPSSVTSIGRGAFSGCSGLTSVTIPDSVTSIGNGAFSNVAPTTLTACFWPIGMASTNLTQLSISGGTTEIGANEFQNLTKLSSLTIPSSVKTIGASAFSGCSLLSEVAIPAGVTAIEESAFSGCSGLQKVVIPASVETIGAGAFAGSAPESLTAAYRPASMSEVCLTEVIVPEGTMEIPANAFADCYEVTTVTIPASVKTIGASAFAGCDALETVNFLGAPPTSVGANAFPEASGTFVMTYVSDWARVINSQGKWHNLTMPDLVKVQITFNANSGSGGTSATLVCGADLTAPTVSRVGYTFRGWSPSVPSTVPAVNTTYTAQWQVNQYTVTFDANGGEGGSSSTVDYGTALTPPTVTRVGHTLTGWSPTPPATVPAKNVTYVAQWAINQYTITFDANGGVGGTSTKMTYAAALTAPEVTREGYTFMGWSPGVPLTVPASDATYVAQWQKNGGTDDPGDDDGDDEPTYTPPTWEVSNYQNNMVVYAQVKDVTTGTFIEAEGSLLAAFDADGVCRGVVEVAPGPYGNLYQLAICSDETSGEAVTLKVWNAATGETIDLSETIDFVSDTEIGLLWEPVVYEIGLTTLETTFNPGWNWFSLNLDIPEGTALGDVFGGWTPANGDQIKSASSIATYYSGAWYPATFTVAPGKMYLVNNSSAEAVAVEIQGTPVSSEQTYTLEAGWNWLGYTGKTAVAVTGAFVDNSVFSNGDVLKSNNQSATYYNGAWYGTLTLTPGQGYKCNVASGATIQYAQSTSAAELSAMPALLAATDAPDWTVSNYQNNMVVYAQIKDTQGNLLEASGSLLAAFDADGVCRGVVEVAPGPVGSIYQLVICSDKTTESGLVLKLWNAADGVIYDVNTSIDFKSDTAIGLLWEPESYSIVETVTKTAVTIEVVGNGTVTGAGQYAEGDEVTLTATAQEGWVFCGWNTNPVTTDATYTFTMGTEEVALTACFAPMSILDAHIDKQGLLTPDEAEQKRDEYIAEHKLKTEAEVAEAIQQHVTDNGLLTPEAANQKRDEYITANNLMSKDDAKQALLDADEVFTADEMKEMAFEAPVVEVGSDAIEISISLQTAEKLNAWEAMALEGATLEVDQAVGKVRVRVPKGDKKAAFYKFVVPTDQSK